MRGLMKNKYSFFLMKHHSDDFIFFHSNVLRLAFEKDKTFEFISSFSSYNHGFQKYVYLPMNKNHNLSHSMAMIHPNRDKYSNIKNME